MNILSLPPATRIGNYKLLKTLGQGGFGITYIAWDVQLERNVVLKECFPAALCRRDESGAILPLSEELAPHYAQAMADMRREACTLAKLNHERVVKVYDVFESHGGLYFVMPWLEGGSLRERMDEAADAGTHIDPALAQQWLVAVLEGLQYLHEQGLIHRDIKPGNIMFDEHDHPVIIDFGAAVFHSAGTATQGEFSMAYAAPEQIAGLGKPFAGTDLYALAVTWYELLSGCLPQETIKRLVQDTLVPLPDLPGMAQLPQPLADFVTYNLQLPAEARDKSARFWADCLAGALPAPKPRKPRRPWLLPLILCLGVAVALPLLVDFSPEAPPAEQPAPAAPPNDLSIDMLYAAFLAHNKKELDAAVAAYHEAEETMESICRTYIASCDLMYCDTQCALALPISEDAVYARRDGELDRLAELSTEFYAQRHECSMQYSKKHGRFISSVISTPENHLPSSSPEQRLRLPLLKDRLYASYAPYQILHEGDYEIDFSYYIDRLLELYAAHFNRKNKKAQKKED